LNAVTVVIYRVVQKNIAQSLMHCHFAIVCSIITWCSTKYSEIIW